MSNIRIRTTPNGGDNFVKIQLEQDFDFIEVLSLKISQEEVYRQFYSDYGVVVGRVFCNSGVGIPNAKVSLFIPLDDNDSENVKSLYPYSDLQTKNKDGVRYNLLPNEYQNQCHTPVGTFPTKNELLNDNNLLEIYEKYYKFTTTTNKSGDFMLFGVPVGNHVLNVDVDLSDIGIFSQRPYDFIEQGSTSKSFKSSTKFREGNNLNNLAQLKHQQIGVNVLPFWGESLSNEVGITRVDVDLNYNIKPAAIFMGSIFGDNEKNSVNKNCIPRKDLGRICETVSGEGTIEMIRKTLDGGIERFDVEGGKVIDSHGAWAYQVPMNLDYMVTDEYGDLVPSEDPTKGIPTRTRVRFRIGMDSTGGEGRIRTRAKFLVPHNPTSSGDQDFTFNKNTKNSHFRDFTWNKIYTVKNHIARMQAFCSIGCADNRRFVGIKDVDDCVGGKNPFPFNRLDGDFNPVFSIICIIIGIIIAILTIINGILSLINGIRIPIIKVYPFRRVKCIPLTCDGTMFSPGCSSRASRAGTTNRSGDDLHECYKIQLAEALDVYEFDFYNDWINGSLFSFLLKYKKRKDSAKFCSVDRGEDIYLVDTLGHGNLKDVDKSKIYHGIVKKYGDELYYAPYGRDKEYMLYATDIYNLGAVFDCDWEGKPSIHEDLVPTTYQIPPFQATDEPDITEMANDGSPPGLLFTLTCLDLRSNSNQIDSIKRLCEIGVGLDENREVNGVTVGKDRMIRNDDIENQKVRDLLIYLNSNKLATDLPYSSGFGDKGNNVSGVDYDNYRNFLDRAINQPKGDSFYFYFGTAPNNSALEKMNAKYFTICEQNIEDAFKINGIVTDATSIGGSNGAIDITIDGGKAPYIYLWSNGNTTQDISGLTVGEYSVRVTDKNGSIVTKIFTVYEPQPIFGDADAYDTEGVPLTSGRINLNSIVGGDGNYLVILTGPSGVITLNNPITPYYYQNLLSGDYTLTISDTAGTPPYVVILKIKDPEKFEPKVEFKDSDCPDPQLNSSIEIEFKGGVPPYTSLTTGPNGYVSTLMMQNDLLAGNYSVTMTDKIGQTKTELGVINVPLENQFTLDNSIQYPFRVQLAGYIPSKAYDFYLNNGETPVGSVTIPFNLFNNYPPLVYNYPSFGVDDKLFFRMSEEGCNSNIIKIQASDIY